MKNKISYLCCDDDPGMRSLAELVAIKGHLRLEFSSPEGTWEAEIDSIADALLKGRVDGLLIDFRLDQTQNVGTGKRSRYTAESVVNELRRRSIEAKRGSDNSYPIILWSTAHNLREYYQINPGYTGLYDGVWDKDDIPRNAQFYRTRLQSLVIGYATLRRAARNSASLATVLKTDATRTQTEMERAFAAKVRQARFAFSYATFILDRLLDCDGPLISRTTCAAILGIDHRDSGLCELVMGKLPDETKYHGVFSDSYERYWRGQLLDSLNALSGGAGWLSLAGQQRAELLRRKFRLRRIVAAEPIHPTYDTDYDTVCAITGQALARRNGYRLYDGLGDRWREPRFVAGVNFRTLTSDKAKSFHLDDDEAARFSRDFS